MTSVKSHFEYLVTYKNKSYFLVVPNKVVKSDTNTMTTEGNTSVESAGVLNTGLELDNYTGIITKDGIKDTVSNGGVVKNIDYYLKIIDDEGSNLETKLENLQKDAIDSGFDVDLPIDDYVFRTKIAEALLKSDYIYSPDNTTTYIDNIIAVKIENLNAGDNNVMSVMVRSAINATVVTNLFLDADNSTSNLHGDEPDLYHRVGVGSNSVTHMIVVKNLNDNLLDSTLLSSSENKNTSLNQNTALKYILIILIVISLINMGINYNTINISHLIVFVLFLIYYYYYDYFSLYLLLKFKEAIYTSKKVNTTNQITSYLYILLLCCISLFFPIMVFSIFNTDFLNNDITDAGVGDAVESATSNVTSSFNSIKDMADDGFEQATSASDNLRNLNASDVSDSFKNAAGSTLKDGMNSANSLKDSYF